MPGKEKRYEGELYVRVPLWVRDAIHQAARGLAITPSDVLRAFVMRPMVAHEGLAPTMAATVGYMEAREEINRARAEKMAMSWEAVDEPISPDVIETIGVRPIKEG